MADAVITKRGILEKALDGGLTKIALDPRVDGVSLPEQFMKEECVVLNLSRRFGNRLEITAEMVKADLLFNKKLFPCEIPMDSIMEILTPNGERHRFLSEEEAAELLAQQEAAQNAPKTPVEPQPEVLFDRTEGIKFTTFEGDGNTTPKKSGHLRLLKN